MRVPDNISSTNTESSSTSSKNSIVFIIIVIVVLATFIYLFVIKEEQDEIQPVQEPIITNTPAYVEPEEQEVEVIEEDIISETIIESEEPISEPIVLPEIDQSDEYIVSGISAMSWRKELLTLLVTDDLVRRVVVFTDNFAQGEIAYSHIPLQPLSKQFIVNKTPAVVTQAGTEQTDTDIFEIASENEARYKQYIELLHSFEPQQLVQYFNENKPLFEQAYSELGYGDQTFDQVLQKALNRILDIQVANTNKALIRPSVVYKYQQQELEQLPAADKFLLRLGKENLLQLKAIALELNNQLQLQ